MYKMLHFIQLLAFINIYSSESVTSYNPRGTNPFPTAMGYLTVITGPMCSAKTTLLINRIRTARLYNESVAVYSHEFDRRKKDFLSSREYPLEEIAAKKIKDPVDLVVDFLAKTGRVVVIDEAQFFPESIVEYVKILLSWRAQIFIAGLDTNFKRDPFGITMGSLCQIADRVIKLKARCSSCGKQTATLTQRLVDGYPASEQDPIVILDDDLLKRSTISYEPRCRNCHVLR